MAGFEGLIKAIEDFKPELGNKLSTYATWWIRQRVLKELNENSTTIRFPSYVRRIRRKVKRIEREKGEELTIAQIQEEFDISAKIANRVKTMKATRSLDAKLDGSETGSLKDILRNPNAKEPSQNSLEEKKSEKLRETMNSNLSDRERRILKLYYGLEDQKPRTLKEVGKVFAVCQERIRQLRDEALDKLRQDGELVAINSETSDR